MRKKVKKGNSRRMKTKKKIVKVNNNLKIAITILAITILLAVYIVLGFTFTLLTGIMIGILAGIWYLLFQ